MLHTDTTQHSILKSNKFFDSFEKRFPIRPTRCKISNPSDSTHLILEINPAHPNYKALAIYNLLKWPDSKKQQTPVQISWKVNHHQPNFQTSLKVNHHWLDSQTSLKVHHHLPDVLTSLKSSLLTKASAI